MGQSDDPTTGNGAPLPLMLATPIHAAITTPSTRNRSVSPHYSPVSATAHLPASLSTTTLDETSPFARLPEELVEQIVLVAAHRHPGSSLALALTSRGVCDITAKARWRTIVLTRAESVAALWRLLVSLDARARFVIRGQETTSSSSEARLWLDEDLGWSVEKSISLPDDPGQYVRHFFLQLPHSRILELSDSLLTASTERAERAAEALAASGAPFDVVQQVKLAPTRAWTRLDGLLELMPCIEVLDLGAAETQLLRPSLLRARPRELILSYDGDDSILATLTWVSHATSLRGTSRSSTDAFAGAILKTHPHFAGLRSRLERLHIVAVDPRAEVAGIPFTVGLFEPLRRGSFRRGSLINTLAVAAHGASQEATTGEATWWNLDAAEANKQEEKRDEQYSSGLTHLRYDTRRFSFKPPEIFAARLRPFFMELSVATPVQLAPTTQYVHTGARHAAPARGAGAAQGHGSSILDAPASLSSTEAMLLREWGVGGLQRLHFAWEPGTPPTNSSSTSVSSLSIPSIPATPPPAGTDSGGWPSERRGAWTDRAGRAPAFATEMTEAIQQLYGWRSSEAHMDAGEYAHKMRQGWSDVDRDNLAEVQTALQRAVAATQPEAPPDAAMRRSVTRTTSQTGVEQKEHKTAQVKYTVRPPASVLKLGGIAAFDGSRRLTLFLDRARGGPGAWA